MIGRGFILLGVLIAVGALAKPSWGNGDGFFEAMEIPGNPAYVVFGAVKDDQGVRLKGATVTIKAAEPALMYFALTDLLGRFRTLDIGRAIKDLGYDIDSSRIEVSVTHPGYRMARKIYRGRRGQNAGAVEMDFVLARDRK